MPLIFRSLDIFPGLAASLALTLVAHGLSYLEIMATGFALMDSLVFAILLGTLVHTVFGLPHVFEAGVRFSSKFVLELAIVLLGASVTAATIAGEGIALICAVALVVALSLLASYGICRALGLSDRLATLVACGNSICGNSAIIATAPVIDARPDDVAASIAFTAALGILVVLLLPLVFSLFGLTQAQYGILAGMTVYAVPQVLAATVPIGAISSQVGTIVKLTRVLMLGPVIFLLALKAGRPGTRLPLGKLVPWFIIGFITMIVARSSDILPHASLPFIEGTASVLTTVSMAALGLSVNLRAVLASGGRVLLAGVLSILMLVSLSAIALTFLPA